MSNRETKNILWVIIFLAVLMGSYETGRKEGDERATKIATACIATNLPIVMGEIKAVAKYAAAGDSYCWMKIRFKPSAEWGFLFSNIENIHVDISKEQNALCNCHIGDKLPLQYDPGAQELAINFNNQIKIRTIQETP